MTVEVVKSDLDAQAIDMSSVDRIMIRQSALAAANVVQTNVQSIALRADAGGGVRRAGFRRRVEGAVPERLSDHAGRRAARLHVCDLRPARGGRRVALHEPGGVARAAERRLGYRVPRRHHRASQCRRGPDRARCGGVRGRVRDHETLADRQRLSLGPFRLAGRQAHPGAPDDRRAVLLVAADLPGQSRPLGGRHLSVRGCDAAAPVRGDRRRHAVAGGVGHCADRRLHGGEEDADPDVPRHREWRQRVGISGRELRFGDRSYRRATPIR